MSAEAADSSMKVLTFNLSGQIFGVPVLQVNDVLKSRKITRTPLAPPSISGIMNLRGRIVTAIDVRSCLGRQPVHNENNMNVVVDHNGELFSLIIDSVGDVLTLSEDTYEETPVTLDPAWRSVASGIHKLEKQILVIIDVAKLLEMAEKGGGPAL